MNAGEFRERIDVLNLLPTENSYRWEPEKQIWAKAERQDKSKLFSTVGIGAKSVKFTIRRRPLTLHNAFRWGGKHCLLTDIKDIDRMYLEISAALAEPVSCSAFRVMESEGENKASFRELREIMRFPAILTEKYLGFTQNVPMAQTEITYVLVTPKEILLEASDLLDVDGRRYAVRVCHTLDEYKNEYEITRKEEH